MGILEVIRPSKRGVVAAAVIAAVSLIAAPVSTYAQHHHAGGGISTGEAVGLGLGAFALGSALSAGAYGYPGYAPGYYAPPPPAYYPPAYAPAPAYYPAPRNCWDSYSQHYYLC